jgi:HAE1 family hydrophobic/amphiphilic exporter-1
VFSGMIGASAIGIFLIPMLYVVFQTMREWSKRRFGGMPAAPPAAPPAAGE